MSAVWTSQTQDQGARHNCPVIPNALSRSLEDFLGGSRDAVVLEDGALVFDLGMARYSVSGEHNKCLLHLWSAERNMVRRVLDLQLKGDMLQLTVQRLGQSRPTRLEFCRRRGSRTLTAKKAARAAYQQKLQRALERHFSELTLTQLSSAIDLERSFGPIYTRGLLRRGQSSFAVIGVSREETQSSIDAALTFGILWLDTCRQTQNNVLVQGLKIFLPAGSSATTRERLAYLNRVAAKWQLYEFDETEDSVAEIDYADRGNLATRLVRCPDHAAARDRFAESIARVKAILPDCDVAVLSLAEIAFRLRGLEFARARVAHDPRSFRSAQEIVFGLGAEERVLCDENQEQFADLLQRASRIRDVSGPRHHPVFRMHPERWLESLVVKNVAFLDETMDGSCLYSQVPAFSASDRAMIDILTATRTGRLAVIELKAEEDIHLPLQGLDYWGRVNWHHCRDEFHHFGYFPGRQLSHEAPLLFLVAPTLRVHPATDTLLRYISPAVDWTLVGIGEGWRGELRVIFRKRKESLQVGTA